MNRNYPAVDGELEDELSQELEDEFEDELEAQLAREFEDEDEDEGLGEFEDELEAALGEFEDEFEDEDFADREDEFEALVRELEAEFELEYEDEDEDFVNPVRRVYPDAELMAELAMQAENAETEEEAEAFLGALAPLAIQAAKWAAPRIIKHAPKLIRGARVLGGRLWRNRRHLVRHMPKILGRAALDIGRDYADGKSITGQHIAKTLVRHAGAAGGTRRPGTRPAHRSARARRVAAAHRAARARRSAQGHRAHGSAHRRKAHRKAGARRRQGRGRGHRR